MPRFVLFEKLNSLSVDLTLLITRRRNISESCYQRVPSKCHKAVLMDRGRRRLMPVSVSVNVPSSSRLEAPAYLSGKLLSSAARSLATSAVFSGAAPPLTTYQQKTASSTTTSGACEKLRSSYVCRVLASVDRTSTCRRNVVTVAPSAAP